jgi:hypothetical protein
METGTVIHEYFYQFSPTAALSVLIVASNTIWMALLKITIKDLLPYCIAGSLFPCRLSA